MPAVDVRTWFNNSFSDVSSYVRSVSIRRGRSDELDRVNAASCTVVLDNRDGRFDPTSTSGPYGTAVALGQLLHVFANIGSGGGTTSRDLFTGYVWDYPPEWPGMRNDEQVALGAMDWMASLGRLGYSSNGGRASEVSGDRVEDVLTQAAGTAHSITFNVDTGQAILTAIPAGGAGGTVTNPLNALQHIQDAATTEGGLFYMLPNGQARFEGREARQNLAYTYCAAIFGDAGTAAPYFASTTLNGTLYAVGSTVNFNSAAAFLAAGMATSGTALWGGAEVAYTMSGTSMVIAGTVSPIPDTWAGFSGSIPAASELQFGEIPYQGLEPKFDDTYLTNEWVVTSSAGSASAVDTASVDRYFRRTQTRETLGVSALELNTTANYLLGRYKAPALRFPSITVKPLQFASGAPAGAAATVMGLGISSRVIVKRRPPGGRFWRQDCLVEGVAFDITQAGKEIIETLNLSPADMTTYWILGTHALDSTARVGY